MDTSLIAISSVFGVSIIIVCGIKYYFVYLNKNKMVQFKNDIAYL